MASRRIVLTGLGALAASLFFARQGKAQTFTYDVFGRVISVTSPNGSTTTYTYDDAGNRTGRSNSSAPPPPPPPPPPPLASTVSPSSLEGTGSEGTPLALVVATGGVAPYLYLWQRLNGSTNIIAGDPTAATTEFGWSGAWSGPPRLSTWRCRVTDAASTVIYTSTIKVSINPSA